MHRGIQKCFFFFFFFFFLSTFLLLTGGKWGQNLLGGGGCPMSPLCYHQFQHFSKKRRGDFSGVDADLHPDKTQEVYFFMCLAPLGNMLSYFSM